MFDLEADHYIDAPDGFEAIPDVEYHDGLTSNQPIATPSGRRLEMHTTIHETL